ncbi:hypothetical protein [Actibacterium ureilyticum]|uniref:hypothetical protein n=1 Tax=Actibacterium ureilyticum TaxID=1590614 RepID=UPI001596350B|nr:hypothetical protein [Actibacterium ureilyticum]
MTVRIAIAFTLTTLCLIGLLVWFSGALVDAVRARAAHSASCNLVPPTSAQMRDICRRG